MHAYQSHIKIRQPKNKKPNNKQTTKTKQKEI